MHNRQLNIYRANKTGNGAASQLQLSLRDDRKPMVFWTIAQQSGTNSNGDATFAWQDKSKNIIVKLGPTDIGEILAVLYGFQAEAKLFHENKEGNTSFNFSRQGIMISNKKGNELLRIKHGISFSDVALMKVILEFAVRVIFDTERK